MPEILIIIVREIMLLDQRTNLPFLEVGNRLSHSRIFSRSNLCFRALFAIDLCIKLARQMT